MNNSKIFNNFINWAKSNSIIDVVLLTGSNANSNVQTDILSDYDIELYVNDVDFFFKNDNWNENFGEVLIKWPLFPESTFDKNWITRLIQYKNGDRIDFQIASSKKIEPIDLDIGYKVLIDKINITKDLKEPTYLNKNIKKPAEEEFKILINDFWWDSLYVAKNLWRDELYYTKFMLDNVLRFNFLQKIIEWYIGLHNNWSVNTGKYGRFFKKYLDKQIWDELENTFSGSNINDNWEAFLNMTSLFRKLSFEISEKLGFQYSNEIDKNVSEYILKIKNLKK